MPDGTFTVGGFQDYINRSTSPASALVDIAKKAICLLPGVLIDGSNIPYSASINPNGAGGTTINGLQKMDYLYHIRGGLRGINLDANLNPTPNAAQGDLFSYKLDYETANQWNGNIGKQTWNTQNQLRGYDFSYDRSQRLTNANYFGPTGENYNLNDLTYDANGNITAMKRYGKGNSGYGLQDNLTYNYQGNRLLGMTDAAGNSHSGTYHADNGSSTDYTYTSHGSIKTDGNRGISNIAYNTYLNRASQVSFTNGSWLKNTYDGAGSVIKREKSNGETWQYVDRFVIKNGQLYSINIPDGRLIKNGANWEKEFYYKDHLGSSVVTFSAQNGQLEAKEYAPVDPFGLDLFGIIQANTTKDNFTYQSKEKLDDFGILGTNDFGARIFDKHSLRWWGVDPLAAKFPHESPYIYCSNNPIIYVDPDGREKYYAADGTYIGKYGASDDIRIVKSAEVANATAAFADPNKVAPDYFTKSLLTTGSHEIYTTADDAANGWGSSYNATSIKDLTEYGSTIYELEIDGKTYVNYSEPTLGSNDGTTVTPAPAGKKAVADIHSHGGYEVGYDNNNFSPQDKKDNERTGLVGYVTTPNGSLKKYDPATKKETVVNETQPSDPKDPDRKNKIN